jgi:dTDP-glucose 4,6-dehydratase
LFLLKKYPLATVVNLDKLDYCSSQYYFKEFADNDDCPQTTSSSDATRPSKRYHFVQGNIMSQDIVRYVLKTHNINVIMHFAAQTHVDNSFGNSLDFLSNNVMGTGNLAECAHQYGKIERFIHVSTDEVYGETAYDDLTTEIGLLKPTNPYAASKAGAEFVVQGYQKSFNFPAIIVRCNNVFGPHQFPEKLIPKFICRLQRDLNCCIHGAGMTKRSFIYVDDVVEAYDIILCKGILGEIYNIEADEELSVLDVTRKILRLTLIAEACVEGGDYPFVNGEDEEEQVEKAFQKRVEYVKDRNFNDLRYAIDGSKLKRLGFVPQWTFEQGLTRTMEWYRENNPEVVWQSAAVEKALLPHSN